MVLYIGIANLSRLCYYVFVMENIQNNHPTEIKIYRDGQLDRMHQLKLHTRHLARFSGQIALTVLHETADCIRIVCEGLDEARGLTNAE